jgi:peroxiredoxin
MARSAPAGQRSWEDVMGLRIDRRMMLAGTTALALFAGSANAAQAAFGPKVGSKAPSIGPLPDQNGAPRTLADLSGEKGVVLMFFRSASWCPYCQAQLIAMNDAASAFGKRGYKIVALSYDAPAATKTFAERRAIAFPLLSDEKSKVIDQWGLRDPQYAPGSYAYGVPRAIIFVIDRAGVVRASLAEEVYQKRPPVSAVLSAIDAIG